MSEEGDPQTNALVRLAEDIAATSDQGRRRTARLLARTEASHQRFRSRRHAGYSRLFDSVTKFGGGSLLTALISLILTGRFSILVPVLIGLALLCLLGGAISTLVNDLRGAGAEHAAERIEAVLKETEQ